MRRSRSVPRSASRVVSPSTSMRSLRTSPSQTVSVSVTVVLSRRTRSFGHGLLRGKHDLVLHEGDLVLLLGDLRSV